MAIFLLLVFIVCSTGLSKRGTAHGLSKGNQKPLYLPNNYIVGKRSAVSQPKNSKQNFAFFVRALCLFIPLLNVVQSQGGRGNKNFMRHLVHDKLKLFHDLAFH